MVLAEPGTTGRTDPACPAAIELDQLTAVLVDELRHSLCPAFRRGELMIANLFRDGAWKPLEEFGVLFATCGLAWVLQSRDLQGASVRLVHEICRADAGRAWRSPERLQVVHGSL